jgi:hypothetical protein
MHQDDYPFPLMTIEAHHQVDLPFNNHIRFTNESQSLKQFTPSMPEWAPSIF